MTLGDFTSKLDLLKEMGCSILIGDSIDKKKIGKEFNQLLAPKGKKTKVSFEETEELTPQEELLADQALKLIHERGNSPLLDSMTQAKVGRLRPNMSREIIAYYRENPGHTTAQAASELAEKFVAHYKDVTDAFKRIRNLINTMCHAKGSQKALEKRGGKSGWGGQQAQVFVV